MLSKVGGRNKGSTNTHAPRVYPQDFVIAKQFVFSGGGDDGGGRAISYGLCTQTVTTSPIEKQMKGKPWQSRQDHSLCCLRRAYRTRAWFHVSRPILRRRNLIPKVVTRSRFVQRAHKLCCVVPKIRGPQPKFLASQHFCVSKRFLHVPVPTLASLPVSIALGGRRKKNRIF